MKPLHVMFITGEYPPMTGGVGAYTAELGKALRCLGVQVTVLTARAAADSNVAAKCAGVRVLPVVQRWDRGVWALIANLAAEARCDWLHVQYQTAAFGMNAAINLAPQRWRSRGQSKGLRVAWTYHDLRPPYLFPKAGPLRTWITLRPAQTADLTVVTNEEDRVQLAERGLAAARIPIGSNIRGQRLSPEERAEWRQAAGYGPDDLLLAYFGFLNRSKGGLALIKTLHRLAEARPNTQLLMIGEQVGASDASNDAYWQEVQALIRRLGLEGRVRWTGSLPDAEVGAALNACDVLLMPYADGASLRRGTLMAGLANGCAIVTTTPPGPLPELLEGRDLLYAPPDDDAAMARAVLRLADDPSLAADLREHARERAAIFTWDAIARAHCEEYARVTAEQEAAGAPAGASKRGSQGAA